MARNPSPTAAGETGTKSFWIALAILTLVLLALFHRSFDSSLVLFSNDGPLGAQAARQNALPAAWTGSWQDLTWLGGSQGAAMPDLTFLLMYLLNPFGYAKYYIPICLLLFGLSGWFLFRRLGFNHTIAALGSIAAALNMNSFSNACWGLGTRPIAFACTFMAIAAISTRTRHTWAKCLVAGLFVGLGVMEASDIGAILSLYAGLFALFYFFQQPGTVAKKITASIGWSAVMVVSSVLVAAYALTSLISTQVVGVAGLEQDAASRERRWDGATMWSLPKTELLRVVIPGLHGYRMDGGYNDIEMTGWNGSPQVGPRGSQYRGAVGQQPDWDQHHQGYPRYSGAGEYAGILVVLVACWAVFGTFLKNTYTDTERRHIRFWAILAAVSVALGIGRHGPFYRILYELPYFSTIRNPMKFMHPFNLIVIILFGYGLHGLTRRYLQTNPIQAPSVLARIKIWLDRASPAEKKWNYLLFLLLGAGVLGLLIFSGSEKGFESHLLGQGLTTPAGAPIDAAQAHTMAAFIAFEIFCFIVLFALAIGILLLVQSGFFNGSRTKWLGLTLGCFLIFDLGRADLPWICYINYKERYTSNPVIDILARQPFEHRVAVLPFQVNDQLGMLQRFYHSLWLQHHFPFYNIQSLDAAQDPRTLEVKTAFLNAVGKSPTRYWQLTNTRYLLGLVPIVPSLNDQLDPSSRRFQVHTPFTLQQDRPGGPIYAVTNAQGPFAILEFTGALPRAQLYTQWQSAPDDKSALEKLSDPAFDPARSLVIDGALPASNGTQAAGTAEIDAASYEPKHVVVKVNAAAASVLLLNDRFDPDWKVTVDGKPETLLRCNYLMRGVQVAAGTHTVDFRFSPSIRPLYISLAGLGLGLVLIGFLAVTARTEDPVQPEPRNPTAR